MPDITMCNGKNKNKVCPKRESCYRYTATPSEFRQSYFVDLPYDFEKESCKYFSPNIPQYDSSTHAGGGHQW